MRRLALVLKTSVSTLVDGIPARWEDTDPTMRQSLDALVECAEEDKLTQTQVQTLWNHYVAEVTPMRLSVAEARFEPRTKSEWRDCAKQGTGRTSATRQIGLRLEDP